MQGNVQGKKFESHASWMTNNRVGLLFAKVDELSPRAWSTMRFNDIQNYYHHVNQIFKSVKDVLTNAEDVQSYRIKYEQLVDMLNSNEEARTMRALTTMLKLTDEMFSLIVTGMQAWEYFFRVGSYQKKGFKNIKFFDDSIFSGGDKDGDTRFAQGVEESQEDSDQYQEGV